MLMTPLLAVVAPAPADAAPADRYERTARSATNDARTSRGRRALGRQACLQRMAERQARRMARQRRMFHQDLGPVLRRCNMSLVGENVAYGYPTGRRVVRAWMNSDGHRRNILDRRFRRMGLAAKRGGGVWWAAQVFGRR